jgi:acetyl esterase/lipase
VTDAPTAPEDLTIDGPHGPLRVRLYRAATPAAGAPGLVWSHGGAFAYGDLEMPESDWVATQLAARGISVLAVDYQLAPEPDVPSFTGPDRRTTGAHFPVASEEVTSAFEWMRDSAERLGVSVDNIVFGGASAGANLTAGAALRLRDAGGQQPRSVILAYPLVHPDLPTPRAQLAEKLAALPDEARFPPEIVELLNLNYVDDPAHLAHPYAFAGGKDLAGLPPTLILNSDADDLRSSGEQFGAELVAAGVDVLVLHEPGTRHGHLNEPENPGALRSIERMAAWITSALV